MAICLAHTFLTCQQEAVSGSYGLTVSPGSKRLCFYIILSTRSLPQGSFPLILLASSQNNAFWGDTSWWHGYNMLWLHLSASVTVSCPLVPLLPWWSLYYNLRWLPQQQPLCLLKQKDRVEERGSLHSLTILPLQILSQNPHPTAPQCFIG